MDKRNEIIILMKRIYQEDKTLTFSDLYSFGSHFYFNEDTYYRVYASALTDICYGYLYNDFASIDYQNFYIAGGVRDYTI